MCTIWFKRLLLGIGCALLLSSLTAVVTQAQPAPPEIRGDDCHKCHEAISTSWQDSVHSQVEEECLEALSQPEESQQSKRCDAYKTIASDHEESDFAMTGVSCQICHPSDPEIHPQKIMYTDTSSRLCGDCHGETLDEFSGTVHNREGMACVRCHNPHNSNLRAGGIQDTCLSCHREEVHFYAFTDHAAEGMLCTDCHFQLAQDEDAGGHRLHTLTVDTENCVHCHGEELHYPLADGQSPPSADPMIVQAGFMPPLGDLDESNLESEPMASSHINFIILAAIIGMLFGLIGSPWIEKWYRRHDDKEL